MSHTIHRREFLGKSVLVGTTLAGVHLGTARGESRSPNEKLAHAAIGVGGMQGLTDFNALTKSPNIQVVALCDVDRNHFKEALTKFPDARLYQDFREMLDREGDRIDSVNITVPDHSHAAIATMALKKGKHVYCQKPLTRTVSEARQLGLAAKQAGVVTRMGNQIHSHTAYRTGVALIQMGAIGRIKEVHSWIGASSKAWWGPNGADRPTHTDAVPAHLNWDVWLGPAPERPYVEKIYHPVNWRAWQSFGSATLGDFGCHVLDPVFTALGLAAPLRLKAHSGPFNDETWPVWCVAEYVFRGTPYTAGKELKVTWYDGGKRPPAEVAELPEGESLPGGGSVFVGTEGQMVLAHVAPPKLYPVKKFKDFPISPSEDGDHYVDWVDACRRGDNTISDDFLYGGLLTETVQLGNIAIRYPNQTLQWDSGQLKITNVAEANRWLTTSHREGFELS